MKSISTLFLVSFISLLSFAQQTDTVSIGAGYTKQVYYSLENGIQSSTIKNDWDLAFETTNQGYSIWINAATGTEAYLYPGDTSDWSTLDTTGIGSWTHRTNSDTSWSYGALSQDQSGFDVGWGTYNMITHAVTGDRIFVLKLSNGNYQKLWIKGLVGGVYTLRHATIVPGMDMTHQLKKSDFTGKNFGFYSLQNHGKVDKEPVAAEWDLFFGQYTTYIPQPYLVTGILQSMGTIASKAYPVNDPSTYSSFGPHPFQTEINIIGYDWKPYNMTTMMYEIVDSTVYFVKTNAGDIWKLIFTHFGGSATGDMVFTKEKIRSAGISSFSQGKAFEIYPNPASDYITIVYDINSNVQMRISSLEGKTVSSDVLSANGLTHQVDVSNLNAGIYIVSLQSENGLQTRKLVIK